MATINKGRRHLLEKVQMGINSRFDGSTAIASFLSEVG